MATEEQRKLFKELASKAVELRKEAERHGSADDAKLGMQGAASWAYAYRIIFEEIEPQINNSGVWVYFKLKPETNFVDDVIEYTRVLQNELDKIDSYRGYYGHI